MNDLQYDYTAKELQKLCKKMPLKWGMVQNDDVDFKIDLFSCHTMTDLLSEINSLSANEQQYFVRRWFMWKCAAVDEYIFSKDPNVLANPNQKDQDWDIEFNKKIRFDVKGTVIPRSMRKTFDLSQEEKLVQYYYNKQSSGVRHNIQNRIFIVHHSYRAEARSLYLRCHWSLKEKAYQAFNQRLTQANINLISYKSVLAKCIFIFETSENEFIFKIN